MKYTRAFCLAVLALLSSVPFVTFAVCDDPTKLCNPITYNNLTEFFLAILDVVVQFSLVLIVFFLVYAGFQFVTAQGNSEKLQKAKQMLVWIVVGAFVILGVRVIRMAICGTLQQIDVQVTCKATNAEI
ncbi:MAG: hypothetical protein COV91_03670 [Candidatus Taylorbacteria bacterium CG11_big_fil_rev_8_21_14_0_20_46_11]|uniref:Uncharacterized protein n=1 Tax=Candidatus Taylorbacteria bacterium CG11_big_fil_rev_8_21_14_0_20_46_11 TaxID=1975025 RepID=A0A2H0KBA3_9BACT|nr:MAG: hypothetical protein COV91_03670 [Candidatus Taylorbacteria bacterium CG11_big_fil_rev_8_21_14_0_20_46_11]